MLNQIKALLNTPQLHQQFKAANSLADVISLIKTANAEQRSHISNNSLTKILQDQFKPTKLGEAELLYITGGFDGYESHTQAVCNTQSC
ncbi:hypothetical protein [Leptothoe spongobia]|uniref:Uncharacterized protein n=1 Tax=Leptothoe spongobia TAU-MAC 1115 TaxID=1967444 RepID=A0A947DH10_9CYAN|nr:hypothetical protein [Leptothoe spongobia]MBT9315786.1 hypothetical protein [Leptothoe spongobia TAU-MAC 1115]